jgi:nitroreductase
MAPFDLDLGFEPAINLLLFIHKVENLMPGMYFYMRNTNDLESLQSQTHSTFLWQSIDPNVPLYLLVEGDFRKKAAQLSCQQQIAGDSAFSIGMITRFQSELEFTPYRYPQLYWEAGMIGQILYLEAEAQGFQGTGIGCYFDDPVHDLLGLSGLEYQSLYHFTVGKAIEDTRLRTFPPYQHLQDLSLSR